MTEEEKEDTLRSASERLGLVLKYAGLPGVYFFADDEDNRYGCYFTDGHCPAMAKTILCPEDFLQIRFFEYYRYPGICRTVVNKFFGASCMEELELRLTSEGIRERSRVWAAG